MLNEDNCGHDRNYCGHKILPIAGMINEDNYGHDRNYCGHKILPIAGIFSAPDAAIPNGHLHAPLV